MTNEQFKQLIEVLTGIKEALEKNNNTITVPPMGFPAPIIGQPINAPLVVNPPRCYPGPCEYPSPWMGIIPPSCTKCGNWSYQPMVTNGTQESTNKITIGIDPGISSDTAIIVQDGKIVGEIRNIGSGGGKDDV